VSSSSSAAASLYVPPAQTRHSCSLLSVKPALQRQASGVTDASGERVLGSQSSKVVCPWLGWKVSGGHALHVGVTRLSSVCVYPAMHWQRTPPSEGFVVLNCDDTRQDVHAVAPSSNANVLPVQDWQASFAVVFLKRPAWHIMACCRGLPTGRSPGRTGSGRRRGCEAATTSLRGRRRRLPPPHTNTR